MPLMNQYKGLIFKTLAVILVLGCVVESITAAAVRNSNPKSSKKQENRIDQSFLDTSSKFRHKRASGDGKATTNSAFMVNAIKALRKDFANLSETMETLSPEDKKSIMVYNDTLYKLQNTPNQKDENIDKMITNDMKTPNFIGVLRTLILNEIVRSIQSHDFSSADDLLQFIDEYKYPASRVYNKTNQNFELLMSFGKSIKDSQRRFKVFEALYNEMKDNGHKDVWQLLKLSEALRNVTDFSTKTILAESQSLRKSLWNENENEAIEPISLAFLNETFAEEVGHLGSDISDACLQCIGDIYQKVMDKVLDNVNTSTVLYRASKLIFVGVHESIFIHEAVFNKLVKNGELYKNTALSLAYYMKLTMDNATYQNATLEMKNRHVNIKNKLPVSARNIIFSSAVCIKNSGNNEFLFASEAAFENKTHPVYTRIPPGVKDVPAQFKWKVQFVDEKLARITNVGNNEFLLASANMYNNERRFVYTATTQNYPLVDLSFEVDGDGLNIKNKFYQEFLFSDSAIKQSNARYVFTYVPKTGLVPMQSRWEAEDCSNFN